MNFIKKPRRMAREPQPEDADQTPGDMAATDNVDVGEAAPPPVSKKSLIVGLLGDENGASLAAIVAATGWLPHTARAALTGLRKKGHVIERFSVDGETRYRIPAAPASASTATEE